MYRPVQKWDCPRCTLQNTSTKCQACGAPYSAPSPLPVHVQQAPPSWDCVVCTLTNNASAKNCSACGVERPNVSSSSSSCSSTFNSPPRASSSSSAHTNPRPPPPIMGSGGSSSSISSTSSTPVRPPPQVISASPIGSSPSISQQTPQQPRTSFSATLTPPPASGASSSSSSLVAGNASPSLTPAASGSPSEVVPPRGPVSGWAIFDEDDEDNFGSLVVAPPSAASSSSSSSSSIVSSSSSSSLQQGSEQKSSSSSSSISSSSSSSSSGVPADLLQFFANDPEAKHSGGSSVFNFATSQPDKSTWECGWCTFNNVATKKECGVCGKPSGSAPERAAGAWNCPLCTLTNDVNVTACSVCSTAKPKAVEEASTPAAAPRESQLRDREQVFGRVMCSRITVVAPYYGTLTISSTHLTFVGTKIEEANNQGADDNIPNTSHMRCKLSDIRQVVPRRFLLRDAALEVCLHDNFTFCFSFWPVDDAFGLSASPRPLAGEDGAEEAPKKKFVITKAVEAERNRVYQVLCTLTDLDKRSIDLVDNPLEASRVLEQWQRGNISNYDYLMFLNLLGGRSRNDISQYPVFPWVLADFGSDTKPDLSNPASFRDLSLPVGALNKDALKEALDRYEALAEQRVLAEKEGNVDDNATPPPFMYGSHYSSPGIVLYFLLRKEPFTTLARKQQGGTFDLANRLFSSVSDTWMLCTLNKGDVKELIPEWFEVDSADDFLLNKARLELGKKQDGSKVDHVILPAWAQGSPVEFVKFHRAALESEFVSQNLHLWIDLIFGFKQTGRAAVAAKNVFFHLTYAGGIDLDCKTDPMTRQALVDQISLYGQTPRQLLISPHPARFTAERIGSTDREDQVLPDIAVEDHEPIGGERPSFPMIAQRVSETMRGAPEIAAAAAGRLREGAFTLGANLASKREGLKTFIRDHGPKKKDKYPTSHAQPATQPAHLAMPANPSPKAASSPKARSSSPAPASPAHVAQPAPLRPEF